MADKDVETVDENIAEGAEPNATVSVEDDVATEPTAESVDTKPEAVEPTEDKETTDQTVPAKEKEPTVETDPKEDKEPVEETDPKEEPVNVEELLADITDKDQQVTKLTDQISIEQEKVTALQTKVTEYETVIKGMVEAKVANVPEEYRELLPDGSLSKQLDWINKAEEKGLFSNEKKTNPAVDIGKPLKSGNADGSKGTPEKVTAHQRLSNFFSGQYGN